MAFHSVSLPAFLLLPRPPGAAAAAENVPSPFAAGSPAGTLPLVTKEIATSSKDATNVAPGITTRSKKLLGWRPSLLGWRPLLLVTSTLLVAPGIWTSNKKLLDAFSFTFAVVPCCLTNGKSINVSCQCYRLTCFESPVSIHPNGEPNGPW